MHKNSCDFMFIVEMKKISQNIFMEGAKRMSEKNIFFVYNL